LSPPSSPLSLTLAQIQSLIAYLPLLNYIDPQEDAEVEVNEIPVISIISTKRISAAEKV